MNDQSDLLKSLRIDNDERSAGKAARGLGPKQQLLAAAAITALAIAGTAAFMGTGSEEAPQVTTPASSNSSGSNSTASNEPTATPPAPTTEPARAVTPAGETVLSASGYITARRMATVAAEITGLITDVLVEEGMTVEAGTVLARLDSAIASVDVERARAQLKAATSRIATVEVNLAEAERVLNRVSKLNVQDFSSEAALTRAKADVDSLKAELVTARADRDVAAITVRAAEEQLDNHTIRAPFSGVVTDKNAQPGEMVSPISAGGGFTRTGICTIVDMGSLEIEVDVNEAYINRVSTGQKVTATLDAYPDWDIPAHVVAIIPTANRERATVRVRIGIDAEDARILPEMGVKVAFLKT